MRGSGQADAAPGGASCPRTADAPGFLLEELGPAERRSFEAHVRTCAVCQAALADFRGVMDGLLEAQPKAALDREFASRVMARLPAEPRRWWPRAAPRLHFAVRPMVRVAAAAALVVGAATLLLWGARGSGTRAPAVAVAPSEQAIDQALGWLARAQESSGAWDCVKWQGQREYEVGLTGLAMLAFLRGSAAPSEEAHEAVIWRSVDYLTRQQDASGAFGPAASGRMYNHGIATVALLEAYRRSQAPGLREPITRAIGFIRAQQLESGGWGYVCRDGEQANTSISVWQLHALQLARAAGIADTTPAYRRGIRWIGGVIDGEGCFGYERRGDFPSGSDTLTAMGAFCLLSAMSPAEAATPEARRVAQALRVVASKGRQDTDFYRWFFLAHALRAAGDESLQAPLDRLHRSLVSMRRTEGAQAGSWEPAGMWSAVGGRIFTTAMATLALQAGHGAPRA